MDNKPRFGIAPASPVSFFIAHNQALMEALVNMPQLAKVLRQVVEGVTLWAEVHAVALDDVELDVRLLTTGEIIVKPKLREAFYGR